MYAAEIVNRNKSDDPRIIKGMSEIIWLYVIHNEDETTFIPENINEYVFVDFFVYNKYIKMNLPDMEMAVAEYAMNNSAIILYMNIVERNIKKGYYESLYDILSKVFAMTFLRGLWSMVFTYS